MSDLIDTDRRRLLGAGAMAVAGARLGLYNPLASASDVALSRVSAGELASLRTATAWVNSPGFTENDVQGKVVLIDVCTYTCINWLRTLPYVRAWGEKYKAPGLVVIGVHAPEFQFEHDVENVRRAMKEMRVEHPIALDNTFSIWRAFRNRYWPSRYLIDARGRIRHQHFGEGEYESSERAIQRALMDAGARGVDHELVSGNGGGIEAAADWDNLRSPETYLGYERSERFASGRLEPDDRHVYQAPSRVRPNEWALAGDWTVKEQAALLNRANGRIAYAFHARDVHLVMGPAAPGGSVRFRVLLDGQSPGSAHGSDVDAQGYGAITDQRLYQLVRQPRPIVDRLITIEFLDAGAEAFAFTFG